MLRLLIFAAVVYFLWKYLISGPKKQKKTEPQPPTVVVTRGEMVKDPICGAYISPESSLKVTQAGTTHYFCGQECRQEYLRRLQAGESQENRRS